MEASESIGSVEGHHLQLHALQWGLPGSGLQGGALEMDPGLRERAVPLPLPPVPCSLLLDLFWVFVKKKIYLKLRIRYREVSMYFLCPFRHCSMGLTRSLEFSRDCTCLIFCSLLVKSQTLKSCVHLWASFFPERCK